MIRWRPWFALIWRKYHTHMMNLQAPAMRSTFRALVTPFCSGCVRVCVEVGDQFGAEKSYPSQPINRDWGLLGRLFHLSQVWTSMDDLGMTTISTHFTHPALNQWKAFFRTTSADRVLNTAHQPFPQHRRGNRTRSFSSWDGRVVNLC